MTSKVSILAACALSVVAALFAAPAFAGECKGVDSASIPATDWVGRKAWLYESRHRFMETDPTQWATIDTFEQTGPIKYSIVKTRLPYAQPVTVVSYLPQDGGPGVAGVELPDGTKHYVSGKAIRFFEFWNCSSDVLLKNRPRHPQFNHGSDQYMREVWVRISNPEAKLVDGVRNWLPSDTVRRMAFAICYSYNPEYVDKIKTGEKPMWCTGYQPDKQGGTNFSADVADLETVSPTSMKILFGS